MVQANEVKKKIVISGYYGFDNIGDEGVLYGILKALHIKVGDHAEITVLSANPQKTEALYGVHAVDRWDKKALYRAIKSCDLLISGGGSLLQDVSSANSPLYYLGVMKLAQLLKKPVVVYAQGIGPLTVRRNRMLTKRIFNKAASITVRDKASAEELRRMGVKRIINVTADPVLGIEQEEVDRELGKNILRDLGFDFEKKTVMVALRSWKTNDFTAPVADCCDRLAQKGWQVLFVPMQLEQDGEILEQTKAAMQQEALLLQRQCTVEEMMSIYSYADSIIGMRLHALIMGVALGKPTVGVIYDPKIEAFLESIANEQVQRWNKMDAKTLAAMVESEFCRYQNLHEMKETVLVPACFVANILQVENVVAKE